MPKTAVVIGAGHGHATASADRCLRYCFMKDRTLVSVSGHTRPPLLSLLTSSEFPEATFPK